MEDTARTAGSARRTTVNVRVAAEAAPRFNVGSRWEVVAASLDSLWEGAYTITLRMIEDEGDGR